ncbi:MAG: penicillin acylase family protein [Chloroflexi bacterium]|nr:penicillin acylase family protein [Chloroflexota bacterium]
MNRAKRIGLVLVTLLLVIIVAASITAVIIARRPFPQTDGTITAAGLNDPVNIYRDEYGIPHIYAENEHDLFFAQGYVHAQDRFWQMEFFRHTGLGRISEITGEPGLGFDRFIRTVGWNRAAERNLAYYEAETPELVEIMQAYSDGVNAYIGENEGQLSINYNILTAVNDPWEIEPWEPLHTIAWAMAMAHDLGGNYNAELDRARLIDALGEATTDSLLPGYNYETRPVIAPTDEQINELETSHKPTTPVVDWSTVSLDLIGAVPENGFGLGQGAGIGSNNWVVSGEHTATGMPLLADDMHLGIQMPSIWYEVGLHAPGWNVLGFSFVGVPGVIAGHNDHIAWGLTNLGPDVQDLFIEKINPANPLQYEFMGEWQDIEVVEEIIKVNGADDEILEVQITHHGPIVTDVVGGDKDVLALQWTALETNRVFQSIIALNQATNYDEFKDALQYWDGPSQNIVYADIEGNIAYQTPGLIPIRQNGDGLTPVPGWTGEYEWEGWIPYAELPALFNPESGYIVTANNAVVDEDYPYLIEIDWANGDRAQRIVEMMETAVSNGNVTADDFATIHFDAKSLVAESYIPLFDNLSSDDAQVQAAIERLRGWDLQERRDSVPAALFEIFYMHLATAVLADDVGDDLVGDAFSQIFFHQLATQPNAVWWDDGNTAVSESREDIMLQALTQTITWFDENVGGDMNEWTWGSIHTATFASNPLGASGIGLIEGIVNRGPFPVDGGSSLVNATSWGWGDPATVRAIPSMRMIVDMSNLDDSIAVNPTGQSGHPYHPHYDDMIPLWQNGKYHDWPFSEAAVVETAVDHLILQPPQQ